jgi:hypothetical protein
LTGGGETSDPQFIRAETKIAEAWAFVRGLRLFDRTATLRRAI